jgi:hypothetical protein
VLNRLVRQYEYAAPIVERPGAKPLEEALAEQRIALDSRTRARDNIPYDMFTDAHLTDIEAGAA